MELACEGETGDVTPLGLVAEDERCRDKTLGCDTLADAARVDINGVDGDATEEKNRACSNRSLTYREKRDFHLVLKVK